MSWVALALFVIIGLFEAGASAEAGGYINLVASLALVAFVVHLIQGRNS